MIVFQQLIHLKNFSFSIDSKSDLGKRSELALSFLRFLLLEMIVLDIVLKFYRFNFKPL